ncbi:lytic polysaccharide monooxygenase auxiliary activity family 9 protein [Streptomyces wuyuanensis]|uniref:Chitin-binding protein n=1 Tax=Streptomyces wuyuanensis TaxID=1196353 RepID=A0A1G9TXK8_9ACTN|nr:lytic polysaccharide monooxygenase [Streptomyces wuyuanensis]SDM52479.1 chitin-binding protein [Streptomyces wuyuanensis]
MSFTHRAPAAAAALLLGAPLFLVAVGAVPAAAHGAPTDPVSRAVACGPRGGHTESAACAAAVDAGGRAMLKEWDNIRVADVAGDDRRVIPDGQLCSAGIEAYRGLDAPRADWPTSRMRAGERFTLAYSSTIPHRGTFSVYLTKDGYDPRTPLSWDDLEREPFLTATDPVLQDGAYRIKGTLPADRAGRHVIYTIWRNSDTPDTYYSCSDVVLTGARSGDGAGGGDERGGGGGAGSDAGAPSASSTPAPQGRATPGAVAQPTAEQPPAADASSASGGVRGSAAAPVAAATDGSDGLPLAVAGAAAALAVIGAAGGHYLRRRRS